MMSNTNNSSQANNYGGVAGDACEDSDSDSVLDAGDNCPATPNTDQANNYGDSRGDVCEDSDNDPEIISAKLPL